ncbi:reverse transcriptase domain-containing protein [Actinomadura sp. 21ATH]|uniref:reverse transcriptase domain-containing protein n=1 Tax=Actinomadura sp. 21ATH TaxID=1735444 RepID=UPI0035C1D318
MNTLNFEKAAATESQTWRNLLPPEPWLHVVGEHPLKFGDYARLRLEAGVPNAPSVVTRARKPHQQTRPVPVVGIPERIAYRALCDHILAAKQPVDRSPNAYQKFITGPILAAFDGQGFRRRLSNVTTQYVVESDITAFYEYVDHSRLLAELQLRTSTVELPRYLIQLLTEIQGRPFGLPQLLDPSDELSEVYVRIIERELRRRGINVWRYNDDFRVTADVYDEAQAYLEALAHEAGVVGLVLNERKTRITKFKRYFWKYWGEAPSEGDVEFKPELITITSDYGEMDADALASVAHETLTRLEAAPGMPDHLDLANLSSDDNYSLRRAIGILTAQADPAGLAHVARLFEYAPHLSHRLGTYLVTLHKSGTDVGSTWDMLVTRSAVYNAWQRVWLAYVARVSKLLTDSTRHAWVQAQRAAADPLLRAEATLALAPHRLASFDEIDRAVRTEPEALLPWYALAARAIPNVNQSRLQALKESHGLIDILLHKVSQETQND